MHGTGEHFRRLAIGQGLSVTPIQLLTAVSAIANGGSLVRPYVVSRMQDEHGRAVLEGQTHLRREPISYETAELLTELLVNVVKTGTGGRAALSDYTVAGKTGTAQKALRHARGYSATKVVGSFVGYVPAEEPRLAMLVIIDEPQSKGWGGVVAAPVFRRVAEQALRHLKVIPQKERMMRIALLDE